MGDYEAGKPEDYDDHGCIFECCYGCEDIIAKKLDDAGVKSKKHAKHAAGLFFIFALTYFFNADPAYSKAFDPCDMKCKPDSDGNFPYFTLILTFIHIGFYIYFVATDPNHNIAGFNKYV